MDETDQVRSYIEEQIKTTKSSLDEFLDVKSDAERHISELTKNLGLLEGMLSYLQGGVPSEEGKASLVEEEIQGAQPYAEMSIADGAFQILTEAGRPLHVTRIWEELEQAGKTSKAQKPTLSVTAALLRDGRFENIGANKFRAKEVLKLVDENS